jgi:hypothetical protein
MRTVSFQGVQLSESERRRLALQQQARSFLNTHLAQQVEQTLEAVDKLREEGTQGENPNKFRLESESRGTPWLGDVFGL